MLKSESETIEIACHSMDLDSTWIVYRKLHEFDNPLTLYHFVFTIPLAAALGPAILCAA